jgi:hypothetical protein
MCFSATGSFAAAGVLTVIGGVSLSRHRSPAYLMLAALPLVFAAQQVTEGIVWMTVDDQHHIQLHRIAVYAFLACALVIWPLWVPVALLRAENEPHHRKRLRALTWLGAAVSIYAVVLLVHGQPISRVARHSLCYDYQSTDDWAGLLYLLPYVTVTVAPFFVSHLNFAKWLGTTFLAALVVSAIFRLGALTSVWCFFSALLSGFLIASIELTHRRMALPKRVPDTAILIATT